MRKSRADSSIEQVTGNGLLHRRAMLGRGLAFAGVAGVASGLPTGAAAEPLTESSPKAPILLTCGAAFRSAKLSMMR